MATGSEPAARADAAPLVGRDRELERLTALAERAREGAPGVALVVGPEGIGKRALVGALVAGCHNFRVVGVDCSPEERALRLGVAGRLLAAIGAPGAAGDGSGSPESAARQGVFAAGEALTAALADLEAEVPVLVTLTEAQWADPESLEALRFALRRLHAERVLIVATGSATGWAATGAWPEGTVRVEVGGLSADAVRALLAPTAGGGDGAAVDRLLAVTGGNPLHLRALLREPDLDRYLDGRAPIPASAADALREALARHPPETRRALEALAVLDGGTLRDVATLAGVPTAAEALAPALADGTLERRGGAPGERLDFASRALRDAVYAGTDLAARRALLLGAAALRSGRPRLRLLVAAAEGPDAGLAAEAAREATRDERLGDLPAAAECLSWAATLSPDPERAAAWRCDAVRLLVHGGREAEALEEAASIAELPATARRSEAMGLLAFAGGRLLAARDLLEEARGAAGDEPALGARIDVELAYLQGVLGDGERARRSALAALAADETPALVAVARAFLAAGTALVEGPEAGLAVLAFLPERATDCAREELPALVQRGVLRALLGELSEAAADLTVASRRLDTAYGRLTGVSAHIHLVWIQYMLGRWDAAAETLRAGILEGERAGRSFDHSVLRSLATILAAGRGEWALAAAELAEARRLAEDSDFLGPLMHLALARGAIAQAEGDFPAVVAALQEITPTSAGPGRVALYRGWWLPAHVEALIATGRLGAAADALSDLAALPRRGAMPAVAEDWLAGELLAARGDHEGGLRRLGDGLRRSGEGGEPMWYRTRLRQAYGRLAPPGDAAGMAELRAAERHYARMGAAPFLERCRDDIAAAAAAPATRAAWLDELTARERDVALLVGRGWTNREIASALFVTAKTVEYHLRNTYMKLGIATRQELRDLVQREAADEIPPA